MGKYQPVLRRPAAMPLTVSWMARASNGSFSPARRRAQFDLQVMQRFEVGVPNTQGLLQDRIAAQQFRFPRHGQHPRHGQLMLLADHVEQSASEGSTSRST